MRAKVERVNVYQCANCGKKEQQTQGVMSMQLRFAGEREYRSVHVCSCICARAVIDRMWSEFYRRVMAEPSKASMAEDAVLAAMGEQR